MAKWTDQRGAQRGEPSPSAALMSALDRYAADQPTRKQVRQRGGVIYRSRRQLAPWYAAATLVSVALLGHVLGIGDLVTFGSWASLAIGTLVFLRRVPPHWRLRFAAAMASGAAWLPWAVEALTWSKFAVLLPAFYGLKARHDKVVRIPTPTHKPDKSRPTATTVMERWDEAVGASGYALPGSYLDNPRTEERNRAVAEVHDGQFVPGKQDLVSAMGMMRQISSGLREPLENLVMDEHPSRDPSRFVFKVVKKGPAQAPVFYSGPKWDNGRVLLGPHSDGDGMAAYVVYIHKRARNGMIIGQTGIGKSRLMEIVCLGARAQQHTALIFLDGQDGMSSPTLADESWAFGPLDAADTFLAGLEAVQAYRQRMMTSSRRLSGFNPSREVPGILVPMDEVHKILNQDNAERWANLFREANKVGMGFLAGDQDGSLSTFKVGVLRGSLQSGNTIGMRTADREQGTILDGNGFNLRDLPDIPGFGLVLNTSGDVRQAPFRGEWLPDQDDIDQGLVPPHIETVDDWYSKIPGIPPDEGSEKAWVSVVSGVGTAEPMLASGVSSGAVVLAFPPPLVFPEDMEDEAPAAPVRTSSLDTVRTAMEVGHLTHGAIVSATGLSDRRVRDLCGDLCEQGVARKVGGHGTYALVDRQATG